MGQEKSSRLGRALCLTALFLLLFTLCRLFPLVGDDWFREALGASLHSPADLLREVAARWSTVNGRVLGNILAYSAGSRPLLREGMRALFTLALIALLARVVRLWSWQGLLLCAAALLALPREMFAQIYPWAAGFFNYLPPVVMLLACLELVRPVLEGRPLEESPVRGGALFLLGFGQQLFIENNTLYALCASFVLLAWYWLERRRWSPCLLALFLGCVLGAALLFASPSYRLIAGEGGAYQSGLGGGLAGLIEAARVNLPEVARYFILDCPILYFGITLLVLAQAIPIAQPAWADWLLLAALPLGALAMYWATAMAAAVFWWLAITAALWRWLSDRSARAWALFLWLSAPVAAGPLLFVSPIGPRCLFLSYVLMLGAAGVLLQALAPERLPAPLTALGSVALAAAVFGFCIHIYLPLHQVELQRTLLLADALAAGEAEVALPTYDHGGWLWDADNAFKMEQYYYREAPGDLTVTFVP